MATAAQIQANRLNALKSTGPRSAEGKAAARFNAVKHGIDAESLLIPGEDAAELEDLHRQYLEEFHPRGPVETALLDTIVRSDWVQRRYVRVESQMFRAIIGAMEPSDYPLGEAFHFDATGPDALQKLFRRQQAAQRDWRRSLTELRTLQQQRSQVSPARDEASPDAASKPVSEQVSGTKSLAATGGNWLRSAPRSEPDPLSPAQLSERSAASGLDPAANPAGAPERSLD